MAIPVTRGSSGCGGIGPLGRSAGAAELAASDCYPSLLGDANAGGKPSELLRRVSAEGELSADTISIEKNPAGKGSCKAQLAGTAFERARCGSGVGGGSVRGTLQAVFSASPKYEVTAEVDRANLGQLPWIPGWAERWNGIASGTDSFNYGRSRQGKNC